MKRIYLSKHEKTVFRMIAEGITSCPDDFSPNYFNAGAHGLQDSDLIRAANTEGGDVYDCRLTPFGKAYLKQNPKLRNPFIETLENSDYVFLVTIISAIITVFNVCIIIWKLNR